MFRRRSLAADMRNANSYEEWLHAARSFEAATGLDGWRSDPKSDHYHHALIRQQLDSLRSMRAAGRIEDLVDHLHESMHRNLGDVSAPELYAVAPTGTKRLIGEYLSEIEATISGLVDSNIPGWPAREKLAVLSRALANFGRTALLLSGGATLGFYHLGVVRALWRAKLLPHVMSGASMGAMIASGICSRSDAELEALFSEEVPDIQLMGLEWRSILGMLRERSLMKPEAMLRVIEANCGRHTFEEAHARSGRTLNISVSPTRISQKPRILCHLTSPNVLISSAALASSAVPGLFPPVTLTQRRGEQERPYIDTETWIDGSFGGDLPMMRMSRLHNVNHFIVSQTNPHVVPFLSGSTQQGVSAFAVGVAVGAMRTQGMQAMQVARTVAGLTPLKGAMELMMSLAQQEYRGDIDIHPRFEPLQYRKILRNPTREDLAHFVIEGERATWPKLAMIRDHTRVARCLERCASRLEARLAEPD